MTLFQNVYNRTAREKTAITPVCPGFREFLGAVVTKGRVEGMWGLGWCWDTLTEFYFQQRFRLLYLRWICHSTVGKSFRKIIVQSSIIVQIQQFQQVLLDAVIVQIRWVPSMERGD